MWRLIRATAEPGKIVGHFLEAEHVGVRHLAGDRDDPRQIGDPVATEAALDIPRQ